MQWDAKAVYDRSRDVIIRYLDPDERWDVQEVLLAGKYIAHFAQPARVDSVEIPAASTRFPRELLDSLPSPDRRETARTKGSPC